MACKRSSVQVRYPPWLEVRKHRKKQCFVPCLLRFLHFLACLMRLLAVPKWHGFSFNRAVFRAALLKSASILSSGPFGEQQIEDESLELGGQLGTVQILRHLVLMRLATAHHGVINGLSKVAEQCLFG